MVRISRLRVLVLLLAFGLLAPPAFAAGSRPSLDGGLLAEGWRTVVSVFPALEKVFGVAGTDGQVLTTESETPGGSETDGRAGQDPNG